MIIVLFILFAGTQLLPNKQGSISSLTKEKIDGSALFFCKEDGELNILLLVTLTQVSLYSWVNKSRKNGKNTRLRIFFFGLESYVRRWS